MSAKMSRKVVPRSKSFSSASVENVSEKPSKPSLRRAVSEKKIKKRVSFRLPIEEDDTRSTKKDSTTSINSNNNDTDEALTKLRLKYGKNSNNSNVRSYKVKKKKRKVLSETNTGYYCTIC